MCGPGQWEHPLDAGASPGSGEFYAGTSVREMLREFRAAVHCRASGIALPI